ncbi:hypothetical protein TB2_024091 [Malus domestica]
MNDESIIPYYCLTGSASLTIQYYEYAARLAVLEKECKGQMQPYVHTLVVEMRTLNLFEQSRNSETASCEFFALISRAAEACFIAPSKARLMTGSHL